MTTTPVTLRAFLREPVDLALGQPHQMLISSASIAIVAAEASSFVPLPFNVALAVGAEWAYLRGLVSGAGVRTRWAGALNLAAVALVFGYGALYGFHSYHLIPEDPPPWLAVVLTIIHIGCIGAVTICSAMMHRVGVDAHAADQRATQARIDAQAEDDRAYEADMKRRRDAQNMELEREWKAEQIKLEAERARAELRASVRSRRAPTASGSPPNTSPNRSREQLRAHVARTLAEHPDTNKAALARDMGIGRTTLYELIDEARANGELAKQQEDR